MRACQHWLKSIERDASRKKLMSSTHQHNAGIPAKLVAAAAAHWRTLLGFAILMLAWEILVRLFGVKLYILPPPSAVFVTLWTKWATIRMAAWYTAQPMLIGYGLAVVVGIGPALSFALSRLMGSIVYP